MIDFKTLPLLAAATETEAEQLRSAAQVIDALPGDALFPDYTITDGFWILTRGNWRVTRRVAGTPQVMFEADRLGTWTGGIPVIDAIAPPKAEVLAPSQFLKIPSAVLERIVSQNPQIAKRLLEAVQWGAGHIGGLIPANQPITSKETNQ